MNHLSTYIAITKGLKSDLQFESVRVDKSYLDQDMVVNSTETTFYFRNGVVLKQCREVDEIVDTEQICSECWLSYEVLSESLMTQVLPKRKTFINHCQESFWLKINKP